MKRSTARAWRSSSLTTSRTRTLVSIPIMAQEPGNSAGTNRFLHFFDGGDPLRLGQDASQRRDVALGGPQTHLAVRLDHEANAVARLQAKLHSDLLRHGDLSLAGHRGFTHGALPKSNFLTLV